MRLTLRTLLSYLDDTLEPSQAKVIGAKVAESEQARELMERIKQVTRRRRLTTPAMSGPGGIDPNTIAEYMDNEVTAEKAAEVEQICLASDVHLAEVAACHQILTLVLGEPALVPPSAKQRMYALVHGPEAIHTRKPGRAPKADMDDLSSELESPDQDETLRLGVPAVGDRRNLMIFVGGGVLAACLLVFAVWRILHTPGNNIVEPKGGEQIVQVEPPKIEPPKDDTKKKIEDKKDEVKKDPIPIEIVKLPNVEVVPVKIDPPLEVPFQPASLKQVPVGDSGPPNFKEPTVLLQAKGDKSGWGRIAGKVATVFSGRPLMSLSGSKNTVDLYSGVELTLWGNLPELTLDPLLLESRATVHSADGLGADLTLHRGRVLIKNKKDDKDVLVRVRFDDPTLSKENHFDIVLQGKGAAVAVERYGELDRDEPFYENPKDPLRNGPTGVMRCYAFAKSAQVRLGTVSYTVDEISQPLVQWQSRQQELVPPKKPYLPYWLKGTPPLKDEAEQAARRYAVKAHDKLADLLENKMIDVALAEFVQAIRQDAQRDIASSKQQQISPETFARWRHAIRCYAAIDDVGYLFNEFTQEKTPAIIRGQCMESLYAWLGLERDHDEKLYDVVRSSHRKTESIKIMELFHRVSTEDARKPIKYQQLIEGLNNNLIAIRALSHWHLFALVPAGRGIPYDPVAAPAAREAAVRMWVQLIPPGQMPPMKK